MAKNHNKKIVLQDAKIPLHHLVWWTKKIKCY